MALAAVVVVGIGSYVFRSVLILATSHREPSPLLRIALDNVGPAVLAALVASSIYTPGEVTPGLPEIGGLVAALVIGMKTKNLLWTSVAGMSVFWALRLL